MTKNQFVTELASKLGKPKSETAEIVDTVFDTIAKTMLGGDSINITGFGIFRVSHRKAREGINPRTGEKIQIPEKKMPKFRPSKNLKEQVM